MYFQGEILLIKNYKINYFFLHIEPVLKMKVILDRDINNNFFRVLPWKYKEIILI